MPRPKRTPETTGLMTWREIAARTGLTERQVQRLFEQGMDKLRAALIDAGITPEEFRSYLHLKDQEQERKAQTAYGIGIHFPSYIGPYSKEPIQ